MPTAAKALVDANTTATNKKKIILMSNGENMEREPYPETQVNAPKAASIVVDTGTFGDNPEPGFVAPLKKVSTETGGTNPRWPSRGPARTTALW